MIFDDTYLIVAAARLWRRTPFKLATLRDERLQVGLHAATVGNRANWLLDVNVSV